MSRKILLIADKEQALAEEYSESLVEEGYRLKVEESYGNHAALFGELMDGGYSAIMLFNNCLSPKHIEVLVPLLRQLFPELKIIVVSGYDNPEFVLELEASGIDEFFNIPIHNHEDFLNRINRVMTAKIR